MCDSYYDEEPPEIDYDLAYETMRDNTCESVMEDIKKLFFHYVKDKSNVNLIYYKDSPERFWEHLKSDCEFELKLLKENGGNNNGRK
jgi:hypothetical protein